MAVPSVQELLRVHTLGRSIDAFCHRRAFARAERLRCGQSWTDAQRSAEEAVSAPDLRKQSRDIHRVSGAC